MRVSLAPAFVLHTRPYRGSSLLVELLTQDYGRIVGLAYAARRGKSPMRGLLQPNTPLLVSWSGKTELMKFSKIEARGLPYALSGAACISGFYVNELLMRLLHRHDPCPTVFALYQQVLVGLDAAESVQEVARGLRIFECALLPALGYGFALNAVADTGVAVQPAEFYAFVPGHGLRRVERDGFLGAHLLAMHQQAWDDPHVLSAAKRLMRVAYRGLLGPKPLKSRSLFASRHAYAA